MKSGEFKKEKVHRDIIGFLQGKFTEFDDIFTDNPGDDDTRKRQKETERSVIKSRIGEINRRGYRLILEGMFHFLSVDVDNDDLTSLVKFRNQIIHNGIPDYKDDPDMRQAARNVTSFCDIVEKVLLAILGYEGKVELYSQSLIID